jgi:hypothetical protein
MTTIRAILLICSFIIAFSCSEGKDRSKEIKISASATAILKSDGTVETREATRKEIKRLDQALEKHNEIDRKYPGPLRHQEIIKLKLYKVKSVSRQIVISVENGPNLILEGVKCNPDYSGYISKLISSETDRIAFIPSTNSEVTPIPAYIWLADMSLMQDREILGPSYSSLNETVITSGWCVPDNSTNNKYIERYQALEELSKM